MISFSLCSLARWYYASSLFKWLALWMLIYTVHDFVYTEVCVQNKSDAKFVLKFPPYLKLKPNFDFHYGQQLNVKFGML